MTLRAPWNVAAWSMMRCISSGQSCISPSMAIPSCSHLIGPAPRRSDCFIRARSVSENRCPLSGSCASVSRHAGRLAMASPINAAILPDIRPMRWLGAILLCAGLCGGMVGGLAAAEDVPNPVPLPRPRPVPPPAWAEPHSFREAAGPGFDSAAVTAEPSDCRKRLEAIATIAPMPRLIGPGACGGGDMVAARRGAARRPRRGRDQAGAGAAL